MKTNLKWRTGARLPGDPLITNIFRLTYGARSIGLAGRDSENDTSRRGGLPSGLLHCFVLHGPAVGRPGKTAKSHSPISRLLSNDKLHSTQLRVPVRNCNLAKVNCLMYPGERESRRPRIEQNEGE